MGLQAKEFDCIADLQHYVLQPQKLTATTSLDQADAEEALTQWLEEAGVEDAWNLAPPLAGMGLTAERLECARASVPAEAVEGFRSGWGRWFQACSNWKRLRKASPG